VKCHYAEWRYTESRGAILTDNSSLSSPPSFVPFAAEKKSFFLQLCLKVFFLHFFRNSILFKYYFRIQQGSMSLLTVL
jgi:hypothetical protein